MAPKHKPYLQAEMNTAENISKEIKQAAIAEKHNDNKEHSTLGIKETEMIASRNNCSVRSVEIAALKVDIIPLRYLRNQRTVSSQDQIRLLESKVAVVGLGGLGGSVVETLARAGVGELTLIDGDLFEEHNLNRQLYCNPGTVGKSKVEAAQRHIFTINQAVKVTTFPTYLTSENGPDLLDKCHVVVDCLDNITARFDVEGSAKNKGIPLVSGALAGLSGHVTTVFPEDAGLVLFYGPQTSLQTPFGAEIIEGCLPQTVSLIAAVESAEVLKILLGRTQNLLRNKLWLLDLGENSAEILSLR